MVLLLARRLPMQRINSPTWRIIFLTEDAHAENAIRPFTIGRKNWLFANTPKGADASAAL